MRSGGEDVSRTSDFGLAKGRASVAELERKLWMCQNIFLVKTTSNEFFPFTFSFFSEGKMRK
jgi:hypothetical protein